MSFNKWETQKPTPKKLPIVINVGKAKPMLDPADLSKEDKQKLWQGTQKNNPALADMLKNDENLAKIKARFDGKIIFELDEATQYMETVQP